MGSRKNVLADFGSLRVAELALEPRLKVHFIDQREYFHRLALYGENNTDYPDNPQRFIFLSKAVVHLARWLPAGPFDLVLLSEVLYYLSPADLERALDAVLARLSQYPSGLTDEEAQNILGMQGNSYRPCRVTLMDKGLVYDTGKRRKTNQRKDAVVWAVTTTGYSTLFQP